MAPHAPHQALQCSADEALKVSGILTQPHGLDKRQTSCRDGGGQDTHHEGPRGASMEASRLPVPSGCRGPSPAQLQLRGRGLGA